MNKSTWVVGILVVVLGLIYFFTKEEKASSSIKRLKMPAFVTDSIDKIEIFGKDKVRITKNGDQWLINIGDEEKPVLVEADQVNIESMLLAAQGVKHSHYVTNLPEKYEELGVKATGTSINLYQEGKPVWALLLGNSASGSTHYAKLPGEADVYVVKGSFWQLTRNGPSDWRDRRVFPVTKDKVKAVTINAKGSLALEKNGGEWAFARTQVLPPDYRADKAALVGLMTAVVSLSASDFVDQPITLGKPIMKVAILANTDYQIEIYPGKDDYLVKRLNDGRVFHITSNMFSAINKSVEDVRDLSLFDFDKKAAIGLKVRHGKDLIVMFKDQEKDQWALKEPIKEGFEFDDRSVDGMLSMLAGLQGARIIQPGDKAKDPNWQKQWLALVEFAEKPPVAVYASVNQANPNEMLVQGNMVAIVQAGRLKTLTSGLNAFKKEDFEFPPIDENTNGFKDLPEDVKRKVLDAVGPKK